MLTKARRMNLAGPAAIARGVASMGVVAVLVFGSSACHSSDGKWNPADSVDKDEVAAAGTGHGEGKDEERGEGHEEEPADGERAAQPGRPAPPERPAGMPESLGGDPVKVVLPLDAIPAIDDPDMIPASEAGDLFDDDEPVIGVFNGAEARAYSAWHLDHHEIVNDKIGDEPIAVTW